MENQTKYPNHTQVQAVRLVEAALDVAALPELFSAEAVECAASYLEQQVASGRATDHGDGADVILEAIAKHFRNWTKASHS